MLLCVAGTILPPTPPQVPTHAPPISHLTFSAFFCAIAGDFFYAAFLIAKRSGIRPFLCFLMALPAGFSPGRSSLLAVVSNRSGALISRSHWFAKEHLQCSPPCRTFHHPKPYTMDLLHWATFPGLRIHAGKGKAKRDLFRKTF